jgi:hypothetical protein
MIGEFQVKTLSPETRALAYQFLFIAFVLGFPFGIATSPIIFRDGDTSWQVAAGDWILKNGRIPTTDPFSFTAAGHPWVAMEWLSQLIYASAFRLAGHAGLATLVAAALFTLDSFLFFYLQRRCSPLLVAGTLLMMDVVLAPFMLARPHVLAWPLLASWTILLLKAAEKGQPPPLWSALILVVWTNLHASFPLALIIAGAIGFDALIAMRGAVLRRWLLFGAASVLALMLNANGLAGLLQPFRTSTLEMLPLIGEWHASSPHATPFFFAALLIGAGALLWSGIAVPIGRLLLLLAMLAMAFAHARHQSTFIIVAACVIPPLFRSKPAASDVPKWLMLGALPLLAFRAIWPLTPPESAANPRQLIAAVPPELRGQPVLNYYTMGGPLILAGIRPFIDGRAELYGDDFVLEYKKMADGDAERFDRAVKKYDIRWTILPIDSRLIRVIESSGKWRRIYSDEVGVIDVRVPPPS